MQPRHVFSLIVLIILCVGVTTASPAGDTWKALRSLEGTWEGIGQGQPGAGGGVFTFTTDLQGQIIVRKSHSEYPAAGGRPATVHDDLLIAYPGDSTTGVRAIYFDNEGHVINYAVTASADGKTVDFISAPQASAPRFRLSYIMKEGDDLVIKFEMAPPGKPEEFKTYIEGKAKRKALATDEHR